MESRITIVLCCALVLGACGADPYEPDRTTAQAPAPSAPASPATTATPPVASAPATDSTTAGTPPATDQTELPGTTAPTVASATGKVDAVDTAAGVITIAHDPVDVLGWPAMTMGFKATPEQIAAVQVGDRVRFDFDTEGSEATIVSIADE